MLVCSCRQWRTSGHADVQRARERAFLALAVAAGDLRGAKWGQHAAPAPKGILRGGMCPCAYAPWLMRTEMHIEVGEDESRWQSHHSHAPDG
jgi:hypothetical protein